MHHSNVLLALLFSTVLINTADLAVVLSKPVDLTWYFENTTVYWVGVQPFEFTKVLATVTEGDFWLAMNEFCAGEHGGTHMDAPYHFNKNGIKIGQITLDKLIVHGALIDMTEETEKTGPATLLQVHHLENWERKHGPIIKNTLFLIKYGWSKYYPDKHSYLGSTYENTTLHFPGMSKEAAEWLAKKEKIVGVGVDTASVDPGSSTTFEAHQILNGHGKYLVENAKLMEPLPVSNFILIALPMNIAEGTGAPLRLVALPKTFDTLV